MADRITVKECALHVNKAPSTLRRLIAKGIISSEKDKRNRNTVCLNEVLSYYAENSDGQTPTKQADNTPTNALRDSLNAQITLLERSLEHEKERNRQEQIRCERLEKTIENLHKEVFTLTTEITHLLKDDKQGNWQLPFRWKRS